MGDKILKILEEALRQFDDGFTHGIKLGDDIEEAKEMLAKNPGNKFWQENLDFHIKHFEDNVENMKKQERIAMEIYHDYRDSLPPALVKKLHEVLDPPAPPAETVEEPAAVETATEIKVICPWLPFELPAEKHVNIPDMDTHAAAFYNETLNDEYRKVFKILAEFFFFVFFECKMFEWRKFFGGDLATEFWRSAHNSSRAKYEAALSYRCAELFIRLLQKKKVTEKISDEMIQQLRETSRRKIQHEERKLIGNEKMTEKYPEEFYRHMEQVEKFREAQMNRPIPKVSTTSSQTSISSECKRTTDEFFGKLKAEQLKSTDCRDLVKTVESLKRHNSNTKVRKIIHKQLISELKKVIEEIENSSEN